MEVSPIAKVIKSEDQSFSPQSLKNMKVSDRPKAPNKELIKAILKPTSAKGSFEKRNPTMVNKGKLGP